MSHWIQPLIAWTNKGLYCAAGGFYIDPHRAVETAIVTHAHSDHARRGSQKYYCEASGVGLLKSRLGSRIGAQGIPYGQKFRLGDVEISLHSAGHILGSAQVRVEHRGEVWVASGDYKRDPDPSCEPFESVRCDTFITEATFGTPKYLWEKNRAHGLDIYEWWQTNAAAGRNSVLFGYSLGKAQRILAELAPFAQRPVVIHETIHDLTECYRQVGRVLAPTRVLPALGNGTAALPGFDLPEMRGELILAPPSILRTEWLARLGRFHTAFASGWMQGASFAHGSRYDYGFVLSDHADWSDINRTIDECGARRVFVQHRDGALVRHLRRRGLDAHSADELVPERYIRLQPVNLSLFG